MNEELWNELPGVEFKMKNSEITGYVKITDKHMYAYCYVHDNINLPYYLDLGYEYKYTINRRGWVLLGYEDETEKPKMSKSHVFKMLFNELEE